MSVPRAIDSASQIDAVLALNNAHAVELSLLDRDRLRAMLAVAPYGRCIGEVDAFLIAFDQDSTYDSPNFLWFQSRYPRFLYVDRIAVAGTARGLGHARRLYDDLFRFAGEAGHHVVTCEINLRPPNPASDRLHQALGFETVGQAAIHGGAKMVRYLARLI